MIRLRVFGTPALEDRDGTPIRPVLAQPKRFALLAYLAIAHPTASVRRDTLLGLFWPELDAEHARMNLRQSLYRLRQSLGAGVLTGKGSEIIGIDPERLWCDAAAFQAALEEDRPEDALPLYDGALLEGFHLAGEREFQRWLDGTRRRLQRRAVKAAGTLTTRAQDEEDRPTALRWAQRAAELAPYDEGVFRRYVQVLREQGDRATAVRAYRAFARRLAEDLDLEPSVETLGLIAEMRRPPPQDTPLHSAGPRGSSSPPDSLTPPDSRTPPNSHTADESEPPDPAGPLRAAPPPAPRTRRPKSSSAESPFRRGARYLPALLLVLMLGYLGFAQLQADDPGTAGSSDIRSLAVLPLEDLSEDAEEEYFADGMTEVLIAELGRLEPLTVISRTSAMHYRDSDLLLPEIARELEVDAVIEGSVLRSGDEVRVTLQLVDGRTDAHLWAESYEGRLGDVLGLQGRVARAVAEEIRLSLTPADEARLAATSSTPTPDSRAYEAYLKGRYFSERLGRDALLTAMAQHRLAVALDSSFALGHAALAEVCAMPALVGRVTTVAQCRAWAEKAIALDEDLAEAHAALGFVRMLDWEWEASEEALRRALELNPGSVMARQWHAELLRRTMRPERALEEMRRAESLDPLNLFVKTMVGWPLFSQGRYDEALAQWDEVLEMDPDYGLALYNQGLVHWMRGKPDETLEAARSAARRMGEDAVVVQVLTAAGHALAQEPDAAREALARAEKSTDRQRPGLMAAVHLTLGEDEAALDWLERGREARDPWLPNTTSEPLLDALRDEPRFRQIVRSMGQEPDALASS